MRRTPHASRRWEKPPSTKPGAIQRGSNENLNGLIRDYYPKGTDFNTVADGEIEVMVRQLSDRPRRTLGFHTPREKLDELISSVALAS